MTTNLLRNSVSSLFLVSAAIFSNYVSADDEDGWRYFGIYGEQNWATVYEDCDGATHKRQSPIDIVGKATIENRDLTQIDLQVIDRARDLPVTVVNNGHTVNLDFNKRAIYISGGSLTGKFRVGGIHFHWGSSDDDGSEHKIEGKHFPMEMHVVTYDETRYPGVIQASHGVDSIAVLSVLFKLSTANNSALDPIVSHLRSVTTAGHPVNMQYFDVQVLLPQNRFRYYRYLGSLTTPPCSESVIWSVFDDNVHISSSQLGEFRKLQELIEADGTIDYLNDNWRTTQPLDDRKIQRSFKSGFDLSFNIISQIALIVTMVIVPQLFV